MEDGTPRHGMGTSALPSSSGGKHATPADVLGPAAAQGSGQLTAATVEPGARAHNERKRRSRDFDAEAPEWSALRAKAPPVLRRRVADDFGDEDAHPDGKGGKADKGGGGKDEEAQRRGGPSATYRDGIEENSLLCMPGDEDDETADGEDIWFARATGPAKQNRITFDCGPSRLIKNHYSVPVEWLNLDELTDEYAIFRVWPTEQDRMATSHLLEMPDLAWEKQEDGRFYMSRTQYDACNDQL